jgi:DNA-binding FadR family transcriptional regulator
MVKDQKDPKPVHDLLKRVKISESSSAPQMLAETLRKGLLELALPEGTRLFGLGDLVQRTGASAGVVREALQQLQSTGLIEIRQGSRGGVFTKRVEQKELVRTLDALVRSNQIPRSAVLEARTELEALCARIAARSAGPDRIAQLKQSAERFASLVDLPNEFAKENIKFHMLVCEATNNPVIVAIVESLRELFFAKSLDITYTKETLELAVRAHRTVVEQIEKGNEEKASDIMTRHVAALEKEISLTDTDAPIPTMN